MLTVKFLNESSERKLGVRVISDHVVEVSGAPANISGFKVYTKDALLLGDYSEYTTLYRTISEDTFQYSNDESVYVVPIITEPSIEEYQEEKVMELHDVQQTIIRNGCEVTLSDGTKERFTLTTEDQLSLNSLSVKTLEGEMAIIPWHQADESVPCRYYSKEDLKLITDACMTFVAYHVTYYRDLRIYVRSLLSREDIQAVVYGMTLPEIYQSSVLKTLTTQLGAQI